ncbi:NYN domain-containing protein [Antarcticimicrobium sediminis]|uniref:NYN domain-containing protein n=1 Tax=Antarcticimicrobium sediminis TaxID=2546227 RepID=A0A4R5EIE8_9RHOB|nr:NYN domain-containing protein [Antarcticimicrobium sediminis]TDE34154.1 NYN domain-containing protein [Antarcticimicrobium sediminis]
MFYKDETLALFIDGPNFYHTARALNFDVDYKRLLETFQAKGRLLRASYFTPLADTEDHVAIRPLVDWMQFNGWTVVTQPARIFEGDDGRRRIKGSTDIALTVEAMNLAPAIAHAVLFTGNRDFAPLVSGLQAKGTRVSVVSTLRAQPPMISDDLRRQADAFVDLDTLRHDIARPARDSAVA